MAKYDCDLLVIGGGPGGYSAAFRAADLGLKVIIAEHRGVLGGVCLNVGCIPSKTYLHQAALIREAQQSAVNGISFGSPTLDFDSLRAHKQSVVKKLNDGLSGLAKGREVLVLSATARLTAATTAELFNVEEKSEIEFKYGLVAVGSDIQRLPFLPEDPRILDSTTALELPAEKGSMLIIGGGIIGLEMATIYSALGMKVDIVELTDDLIPGADRDLVAVWQKANRKWLGKVMLGTRVTEVECTPEGVGVTFGDEAKAGHYDYVLAATGRVPNGHSVSADWTGLNVDKNGFIPVDLQLRTNVATLFAVGDVVGTPMLAHKAVHQGHIAAEVIAGEIKGSKELSRVAFDATVIPTVAYTNPEISWAGLTESEAKTAGIDVKVSKFPWAASGRALANSCDSGFTKLLSDPASGIVLGGAIVGPNAGDMIGEVALAIELGAEAMDLALTIHPHPTLGETIGLAAELASGWCTDLPATSEG